jgi:predicted outer membrane protein
MIRLSKISAALLLLFSTSFALACDYPARPSIPDGAAASKDELLAAKDAIQQFMAEVDTYLKCIESEEQSAMAELDNPSPEEVQRREEMLNKKFDAANEEKALLGEQFNQQIRLYNARLQEEKSD